MNNIYCWENYSQKDISSICLELKKILGEDPICLYFEGEMGVGKTTFIKSLAYLINKGDLASPTYCILTEEREILHGDFYRIKNINEITFLELELYCQNKKYLFFEWGYQFFSRIDQDIPELFNKYCLKIKKNSQNNLRNATLFEIFDYK